MPLCSSFDTASSSWTDIELILKVEHFGVMIIEIKYIFQVLCVFDINYLFTNKSSEKERKKKHFKIFFTHFHFWRNNYC